MPVELHPPQPVISGYCHVIDGDTIVIDGWHIRLAGIDAPELDHPWGQKSKWALVALCKGQRVTARLKPELTHDRLVAECFLPDGRDLAAELVKAGLALDWPKFSGGKYRSLEPADARQKLWRARLRQGGMMWPMDDIVPNPTRPVGPSSVPQQVRPKPAAPSAPSRRVNYRLGWLIVGGVLMLLVGCNIVGGGTAPTAPAGPVRQAAAFSSFEVSASVLNVRKSPSANAPVIAQIRKGTTVVPKQLYDSWYAIVMGDGNTGWVHREYLSPSGE